MQTQTTFPQAQHSTAPAPSFPLQTLRDVLDLALEAHPTEAPRLRRAANIVALRTILPVGTETAYSVQSEEDDAATYTVDLRARTCTCPDFQRRGCRCKHWWAVALLKAAYGLEAQYQRARDYGALDRYELTPKGEAYLAATAAAEPAPAA